MKLQKDGKGKDRECLATHLDIQVNVGLAQTFDMYQRK